MPKPKTPKSIPTKLEKAEERQPETPKGSILQVDPSILDGLKNATQLEVDAQTEEQERLDEIKRLKFKNKALFYVGVFAGVGLLYLLFNCSKTQPDSRYLPEIINAVVAP